MPKLPIIPYEAVSDYRPITLHMTFRLSWTAARTADFRTVQTIDPHLSWDRPPPQTASM